MGIVAKRSNSVRSGKLGVAKSAMEAAQQLQPETVEPAHYLARIALVQNQTETAHKNLLELEIAFQGESRTLSRLQL